MRKLNKKRGIKFRIEFELHNAWGARQLTTPFVSFFWGCDKDKRNNANMIEIGVILFRFQIWWGATGDLTPQRKWWKNLFGKEK